MKTNTDLQQALNFIREQRQEEATALLTQVLSSEPGNVAARWLLVQSLESQGQLDSALDQLRKLLSHVKNDLPAIDRVASHMHQRRYPLNHSLEAYRKYLSAEPGSANAAFNYAWYLAKDGQFEAAIKQYERALNLDIATPEEVHLNIANLYMDHLYDRGHARKHLDTALSLNPSYASAFYNLGNLAEQEGNRGEARLNFERCLQADPANESALARLADTHKFEEQQDPLLATLVETAKSSDNSDVHFALGRAYEQSGNFGLAWDHFTRGNALDERAMPSYKPEDTEAYFKHLMTQSENSWQGHDEDLAQPPVFICGMFRSGSTLLEQMLAAHPRFVAGGEREFFPRLVARELPDYPLGAAAISADKLRRWHEQHIEHTEKHFGHSCRLTDKRPDNFLTIGLIKAVLPSAKFVVTERDWRDVATSIYSVRLGPGQSYATRLENIRHYIMLQSQLIDFWGTQLGPDLIRVRYEDLVREPQTTITDLLAGLGEDWDERCLSFHELTNNVRTASVWQVREPLNSRSVGRWKRYEQQFVAALGNTLND